MDDIQLEVPTITKQPKSPPLAFEKTSNDALWAPLNPIQAQALSHVSSPYFLSGSPSENELQVQIDKLNEALDLQHMAFVAERESWKLEKDRLYRRITALESLLKNPNGQSPARSPVVSPQSGVRTFSAISHLPSIAEVDSSPQQRNMLARSKRGSAPARIDISTIANPASVAQAHDTEEAIKPDFPMSPPVTRNALSPPPLVNRHMAGHTPLKAPRPPGNFSPAMSLLSEKLSDTPTRSNTALNETMAQDDSIDDDDDKALRGPLHMPEVPGSPGQGHFSMEMLSAKLKHVMEHPEENEPFALRSTSPVYTDDTSVTPPPDTTDIAVPKVDSANSAEITGKENDMDNGGIKLRKKMSSNFGAPLGQMGSWKF